MSYNKETGLFEGYIYCITNKVNGKLYIGQTITTVKNRWACHKHNAKSGRSDMALYHAMRKYGVDSFKIELVEKFFSNTKESLVSTLNKKEIYYIDKFKSLYNENGYNVTKGGDNGSLRISRKILQYDLKLNLIAKFNSIVEASDKTGIAYCLIVSNCSGKQQTTKGYIFCYEEDTPKSPFVEHRFGSVNIYKYTYKQLMALYASSWTGENIVQYNLYGEIVGDYNNPIDISIKYKEPLSKVMIYVGNNNRFYDTILLYKSQLFDTEEIYKEIRPISAYDLQGNFQMRFISIAQTSKCLGYGVNEIIYALQHKIRYKNHLFSYYGELPPETHRRHGRQINMVDDNGNVVKEFICGKQIADYYGKNDVHSMIGNAIRKKTKYKGYYWQYKDDPLTV